MAAAADAIRARNNFSSGVQPPAHSAAAWQAALNVPPAFSIFSTAALEAPATSNVNLAFRSPSDSNANAILGAADNAGRVQRLGVNRLLGIELAGIDRSLDAAERHDVEFLAKILLKPRFGSRMWSGIWPPSKPLMATPERDFWPLTPRPAVLPVPEPMPRPTRLRRLGRRLRCRAVR